MDREDLSEQFREIERLVEQAPQVAWDRLLSFVAEGGPQLEAEMLLERLLNRHGEFIGVIEAEAAKNNRFAEIVEATPIFEPATPEIDRFHALQRRLRDRLGIPYWEGWSSFDGDEDRR